VRLWKGADTYRDRGSDAHDRSHDRRRPEEKGGSDMGSNTDLFKARLEHSIGTEKKRRRHVISLKRLAYVQIILFCQDDTAMCERALDERDIAVLEEIYPLQRLVAFAILSI
jgi:hypothetical protein